MGQLNINMTPEFERDLRKYMKERNINTKAEAVRTAIKEGLDRINPKRTDFSSWIGKATKAPISKQPKFKSHDDLWK